MKFSVLVALFFCVQLSAQTSAENEVKLKQLRELKIDFHQRTAGEYDGFRINIHSGGDKENARKVKAKFQNLFPDIAVYEKYEQPNFTILVGDFRTELEAWGFREKISYDFPNAFVKKKVMIKPAKL
jgi:hypothetical protein